MGNKQTAVGMKIIDIEDEDCYYEGIVVQLNPVKYKISKIVWNGEIDTSMNGQIIEPKWWEFKTIET